MTDTIRLFEMTRIGSGEDLGELLVELPVALAERQASPRVVFMNTGSLLGWSAFVVGADGVVLLSFPWTDHVDRVLVEQDAVGLPVHLTEAGWVDLEQGWWGEIVVKDEDVYVAETNLDAITDVKEAGNLEHPRPGVVLVEGVEVSWNVVPRSAWNEAWQAALEACKRGTPSPVGEWADESQMRPFRLIVRE